jgi:hypothetical protein
MSSAHAHTQRTRRKTRCIDIKRGVFHHGASGRDALFGWRTIPIVPMNAILSRQYSRKIRPMSAELIVES